MSRKLAFRYAAGRGLANLAKAHHAPGLGTAVGEVLLFLQSPREALVTSASVFRNGGLSLSLFLGFGLGVLSV
jgi:hypothetical protein